jgi:hypothetical protein
MQKQNVMQMRVSMVIVMEQEHVRCNQVPPIVEYVPYVMVQGTVRCMMPARMLIVEYVKNVLL